MTSSDFSFEARRRRMVRNPYWRQPRAYSEVTDEDMPELMSGSGRSSNSESSTSSSSSSSLMVTFSSDGGRRVRATDQSGGNGSSRQRMAAGDGESGGAQGKDHVDFPQGYFTDCHKAVKIKIVEGMEGARLLKSKSLTPQSSSASAITIRRTGSRASLTVDSFHKRGGASKCKSVNLGNGDLTRVALRFAGTNHLQVPATPTASETVQGTSFRPLELEIRTLVRVLTGEHHVIWPMRPAEMSTWILARPLHNYQAASAPWMASRDASAFHPWTYSQRARMYPRNHQINEHWPVSSSTIDRNGSQSDYWIIQLVRDNLTNMPLYARIAIRECQTLTINRDGRHYFAFEHVRERSPTSIPSYPLEACGWIECYRGVELRYDEYLLEEICYPDRPRVIRIVTREGRYHIIDIEDHEHVSRIIHFQYE